MSVAWDSSVDNTGYKLNQVSHCSEISLATPKKLFVKLRQTDHQIVIFLVVQLNEVCTMDSNFYTLCQGLLITRNVSSDEDDGDGGSSNSRNNS